MLVSMFPLESDKICDGIAAFVGVMNAFSTLIIVGMYLNAHNAFKTDALRAKLY